MGWPFLLPPECRPVNLNSNFRKIQMKRNYTKLLFVNTLLVIGILITLTSQAQFITQWRTTGSNEMITIPTIGSGYNYHVNWGDGNSSVATGNVSHNYTGAGIYVVSITGAFPRIYFNDTAESRDKIIDISQWGTNAWQSMNSAFKGCINLNITATDAPVLSSVTDMSDMFYDCKKLNPMGAAATGLNNWLTNGVTTMEGMFDGATIFNQDISKWNTANVMNMEAMFQNATAFNQDIGNWNTSNVTDMRGMFLGELAPAAFNQDIGHWNTSNVTDMGYMFWRATSFNQDISSWNTAKVTQMGSVFFGATAFNQDIGHWNTAKVIDMDGMFWGATAFNQDIGSWKIADLNNMEYMLNDCGLSVANYDKILIGWARQALPINVVLGARGLKYCAGANARNTLISTYGWTINDDSLSCVLPLSLKIFPNPTTGPTTISNIETGDVIVLTDVIGQKILKQLATGETQKLNINFLAPGVYLISIFRGGKIIMTDKITKLN